MKLKYGGWYVKDLKLSKINDVKKERIESTDDVNEAKEFNNENEINEFIKKCKILNYDIKSFEVLENENNR